MPSEPSPHPSGPTRTSRKRQIPLNDNGDPVTMPANKKRKVVPPIGKAGPSATKKTTIAKLGPPNKTTIKSVPDKKGKGRQSVEIENVPDENDRIPLNPPRNPGSILELSSDDEDPSPSAACDGEPEVIEESEEDDEAELSEILLHTTNSYSPNLL